MSIEDRRILRQAGLSQAETAQFLGKSRQTVGHGIARDNNHYLDFERCEIIAKALKESDKEKLSRLLVALEENGRRYARGLNALLDSGDHRTLSLGDDPFEFYKKEIWIFSNEPAELERGDFLKYMSDQHYTRSDRRFVYFLTPGQNADQLAQILRHRCRQIEKATGKLAAISVITTNAMTLVPHSIIFDATVMDDAIEPRGYARGRTIGLKSDETGPTQFFELPHEAVTSMINSVRTAGIGLSDDYFFPEEAKLNEELPATKDTFYTVTFSTELEA